MATQPRRPWYSDGLRFACQPDCGACCTTHGTYAYVYLEGHDLERLATFLELTPAEFRDLYTTEDDGEPILNMDRPECPFLEGTRCSVYPARPTQCRTFPFWKESLTSRAAWSKLGRFCPGIGRGEPVPLVEIKGLLDERGGGE